MKASWFSSVVVGLLLVVGLYFPTSRDGVILREFQWLFSGVLLLLLLCLLGRRGGLLGGLSLPVVAAISAVLFMATLFSPLTKYAYGAYIPVLLLSVLFCVRLNGLPLANSHRFLFTAANLVNIAGGLLVILQEPLVLSFIKDNYSAAYPELVPYMLSERKPILMFYSHSVAGFHFYIFFLMTFRAYQVNGSRLNLILAFTYLLLAFWISSFTAYLFVGLALIEVILHFRRLRTGAVGLTFALAVCGGAIYLLSEHTADELWLRFHLALESEGNGFQGRYSGTGALIPNLEYIAQHPWSPIGLGFSHNFVYGDSGPLNYWMRGSAPLVILVYTSFFLFLRKNLRSKRDAILLFLVYASFELGYGNLESLRSQYLLPFLIVYLNGLPCRRAAPVPALARTRCPGVGLSAAHAAG